MLLRTEIMALSKWIVYYFGYRENIGENVLNQSSNVETNSKKSFGKSSDWNRTGPAGWTAEMLSLASTPVVPWLSYLLRGPRFMGSNPAGVDGFFSKPKNREYDFLWKEVKPWVLWRRFTARKRTSSRNKSLWAKFVGLFPLTVESYANDLKY